MQRLVGRQSGITLIEVIIAISVITGMVLVIGFSVTSYVNARTALLNNTKALYLTEEGYELLRVLRDENWDDIAALTLGNTYSFAVTDTTLAISSTVEVIDSAFYRSFTVEAVKRDANDDIDLTSGSGTTDADTRLVTVSVFGPTGTTSLSAILTNIKAI